MKNLLILVFCSISLLFGNDSELLGVWDTGKDNTKVEIAKINRKLVGKIKSTDNKNAKIGNTILKDIVQDGDEWSAKIYAPKKDDWFDAELEVEESTLEITISVGFMSKTLEWKKVKQ